MQNHSYLLPLMLLMANPAAAAPRAAAELTMQYHKSADRQTTDGGCLFAKCEYLGSGDGAGTGKLAGRISWDLFEDQSRDDLHPTQFRGFIERDGERHSFHIIGVFTPDGLGKALRWYLSGTIVFDDERLLGARHAAVTGDVQIGVWKHRYTVWLDSDAAR